jgi:hypothetical protein
VTPELLQFSRGSATGAFAVQTQNACKWTASTRDTWIRITTASGTGAGDVRFSLEHNNGAERAGTISVGGVTVRVEQEGRSRHVSLNGSISNVTGTCPSVTFTLQEQVVFTDESTRFKDSCTALADGTRVKVEADQTTSGQVHAAVVEVR